MDEELKDKGILIDGKEAKRQFLEELRSKNEEEDKKIEDAQNNEANNANEEEEEKKKFLEEIRKNNENKKVENNKTDETDNLEIENKEIVNNEEPNKEIVNNENEEENNEIESELSKDEDSEDNEPKDNEIEENTDLSLVNSEVSKKEGKKFFNGILKCSLIDAAITALGSLLCLYLFDLLLRIPGYQVVDFKGIYIIIFLIMSVLYPVIMCNSKQGKTLGQKIGKIQVQEREE